MPELGEGADGEKSFNEDKADDVILLASLQHGDLSSCASVCDESLIFSFEVACGGQITARYD